MPMRDAINIWWNLHGTSCEQHCPIAVSHATAYYQRKLSEFNGYGLEDRTSIPGRDRFFLFEDIFRPALKQNQLFHPISTEYSGREYGSSVKLIITI
jgi:hypothetical protein